MLATGSTGGLGGSFSASALGKRWEFFPGKGAALRIAVSATGSVSLVGSNFRTALAGAISLSTETTFAVSGLDPNCPCEKNPPGTRRTSLFKKLEQLRLE